MTYTFTNKITGEFLDLNVESLVEVQEAWRLAQEYERIAKEMKDKIKPVVRDYITYTGLTERAGNFHFRQSYVQRKEYDKRLLRKYFDDDVLDVMLKPDKKIIDTYIKENLESLPPEASEIRKNMIDVGEPYEVIKLERVKNDL